MTFLHHLDEPATSELPTEQIEGLCRHEVYRYALRRLASPQDAEDVAAEVYLAAFATRWRKGMDPRPWLLGIARRKVVDRLRRRDRRPEMPLLECHTTSFLSEDLHFDALRAEAVLKMRELVLALPDAQREALLLQVADGLPIGEIAQVMRKSPSAVNSLLGRARETLRRTGRDYFED